MEARKWTATVALWLAGGLVTAPAAGQPRGTGTQAEANGEAVTEGGPKTGSATEVEQEYGAVAVVPVPGARLLLERYPRNAQTLDYRLLERELPLGLHDALSTRLSGVVVNDVQSNPLQPDLQYRGFTASPLLGSPQGIAIYQNGVRINEPFGDVMQWDLVPQFAIDEIQLLPGSNPLYGLNALGGSLALRMKNGFRNQGHRVQGLGGSWGRYQAIGEYGRSFEDSWAFYGGVSVFGEQGWRDHSPSQAWNVFTDVRHEAGRHEVGLNLTFADTSLTGNGPAPVEMLEQDRSAVFTHPDVTENSLVSVSSDMRYQASEHVSILATAYFRHLHRGTLNGDEGDFAVCPSEDGTGQLLCDEDMETILSETGRVIPTHDPHDGLLNTTGTQSDGGGGSAQLLVEEDLFGHGNQFILGASYDGSIVQYLQRAELGYLTGNRAVNGQGIWLGGDEYRTELQVDNHHLGVFATDTLELVADLAINLSARFNYSHIHMRDQMGTALNGNHAYNRVNPAVGLTYGPLPALTLFAGYGEANRVPSAAELACADPDQPCRLPNAFVADPPLEQVVSRSVEVGVRGALGPEHRPTLKWSLAGHGSRNQDEILFVAGSRVGTGYFRNAGQTQRVGMEADVSGGDGPYDWFVSYAFLNATFESELDLPGGAHPGAMGGGGDDGGESIRVQPGNRMTGLPQHSVRLGFRVRPVERWEIGVTILGQSDQFLRGDESNQLDPLQGYMILNAQTSYLLFDHLRLFVKAQNLTDAKYETFGIVGDPSEVVPSLSTPRFVSPGAPIGLWAGLSLSDF